MCSFIIPSTKYLISFCKSFLDFLLLLIAFPCHTFLWLSMPIVCGICGHIKAWWDNHPNCLSCSSCSRLSTCSTCNLWSEKIWDLADKKRLYSARKSTMRKKKQTKKRSCLFRRVWRQLFLDGGTTPHGFTAGGKIHRGGNYMGAGGTQSMSTRHCLPVTRHQAPVSFTRHWSTRHLATYHRSTRHGLPGTSQPGTGQIITGQPGTWQPGTSQPVTSHLIPVTRHWLSSSDYQTPGILSPGTSHWVTSHWAPGTSQLTRHRSSGNNRLALNTSCPVRHLRVLSIHYQMSLRTQEVLKGYMYCYHWSQTLVPC